MVRKGQTDPDENFTLESDSDVSATIRHAAEDMEIADLEDNLAARLAKCKEELAVCQKERQEYLDGWQRAKADFLNSKQRAKQEREEERERDRAYFATQLLPLCDSFDRALASLENGGEARGENSQPPEHWRVGVAQIYNQLSAVLTALGVEPLIPQGEPFDPRFHEAVSEQPVADEKQDHAVLEVLQKGYRIGERLLRPAQVVVGKYANE